MDMKIRTHDTTTNGLIPMEALERVAPIIRNISHPLRLRILDFLHSAGEPRTVGEIITATGGEQAVVSQHLRVLRDQGVVSAKREGSYMFYAILDDSVLLVLDCIRKHTSARK
ncbi:MAG: transcriptional regulator, ArsR family [Chthonomonadaceae bacterium]|nr:transcriptional regulator, ArsR family [Chthonomonadaceae bacterium]